MEASKEEHGVSDGGGGDGGDSGGGGDGDEGGERRWRGNV